MAGDVSSNLHYEVSQTRPPCRLVFVIPAHVNKGALLFCSALLQNLFRIRNLILPRALLALDQSAHLQIWEQINTFSGPQRFFFFVLQFAENQYALFLSHHSPNGSGGGSAHLQVVTSVQGMAGRVSAPGVIYLISNSFWEESPGAVPIFAERFRVSRLTGQEGKDGLCGGR